MALTEIPSELSSTPSIVDNGNATAITINADESVIVSKQLTLPLAIGDRPILQGGFLSKLADDGDADIWGVSETYYPSNGTATDAWGIRWASNPNEIQFVGSGTNKLRIDLDTAGKVYIDNNEVWHAGNDGAGSGLDADLLDGLHATSFASSTFNVANTSSSDPNTDTSAYFLTNHANAPFGSTYSHIQNHWYSSVGGNVSQHATAYNSSPARFAVRHRYSGTWTAWSEAWTSGNDDGQLITKSGNSYYQLDTWLQSTSTHLLYSPSSGAGTHFNASITSYGAYHVLGNKNGYTGFELGSASGVVTGMYDPAGNGGEWNPTTGWHYYYHRANDCLGVSGSPTSSAYGLYVSGGIYATGSITPSDRRLKENIRTIDNALETVEEMRGVYYNRIDDEKKKTEIGFIAQEVDEIEGAKPLITYAEDIDQFGVSYGNTTALLVEAVKELSQQVKDLQIEVKELRNG